MDANATGNLAEWVGAIGQSATALLAAVIAFLAYRHSQRTIQATCQKHLSDLVNGWNMMVATSSENIQVVARLREPVIAYPDDFIVYTYLNFLRTSQEMYQTALIPASVAQAIIKNGITWLLAIPRDKLVPGITDARRNPQR